MDYFWRALDAIRSVATVIEPIRPDQLASENISTSQRDAAEPPRQIDPTRLETACSTLPRELVFRILSFTLPPPGFSTGLDRRRLLVDYASFDRDFARWATAELRRNVYLATASDAIRFSDVAATTSPESRSVVASIRLGVSDPARATFVNSIWASDKTTKVVSDLLRLCPNVEELWIAGVRDLELGVLSNGSNLRKLCLSETRIVPSSRTRYRRLSLPRLRAMHLKAVICTGSSLHDLLDPRCVPELDTLDFLSVHQSVVAHNNVRNPRDPAQGAQPNLQQLNAMFASLRPRAMSRGDQPVAIGPPYEAVAPRLRHLALGPHATRTLPASALTLFTSLVTLSLPIRLFLNREVAPDDLSPTLRAIRLTNETTTRTDDDVDNFRFRNDDLLAGADAASTALSQRAFSSTGLSDGAIDQAPLDVGRVSGSSESLATENGVSAVSVYVDASSWPPRVLRHLESASSRCDAHDGLWDLGHERWREREGLSPP
ncbi:hypothetical protein JCM10212_006746 [Sporobolomyces blumeae]